MNIDITKLAEHVRNGIVREQRHDSLPLAIYNYSATCQYERLWDDVTLQCRGLVMHGDTIVARPFRKFFNDTEYKPEEIPWHLPSEITEKMDGSLLIVFFFEGQWHFATRGSFTSGQAKVGERIFKTKYQNVRLDVSLTYLFEVIYPQNRHVVNYGEREDVVLLAMIETATGCEIPLRYADGLCVVNRLSATESLQSLRSIIRDDQEGYVVRFSNGFRVKVKGQRYIELHKLITGVSSRTIWEYLSQEKPFAELLEMVPDEFAQWVRQEQIAQLSEYGRLMRKVIEAQCAVADLPDRKSKALKLIGDYKDVSSAVFASMDKKPISPIIWKQLYPEFRRPEIAGRLDA